MMMLSKVLGGMKGGGGQQGGGGGGGQQGGGGGGLDLIANSSLGKSAALWTGAFDLLRARKAKREADALMPSLYDPNQLALLSEIEQKRRSINTGSAFAADINEIQSGTAQAMGSISRVTGGDVSGTVNALLAAQQAGARATNQALAKSDQMGLQYDNLYSNMAKRISDRAMQLQLAERTQKLAEWAQSRQDAWANLNVGIARTQAPSQSQSPDWGDIFMRNKSAEAGGAPTEQPLDPVQQARQLLPMATPDLGQAEPGGSMGVPDVPLEAGAGIIGGM